MRFASHQAIQFLLSDVTEWRVAEVMRQAGRPDSGNIELEALILAAQGFADDRTHMFDPQGVGQPIVQTRSNRSYRRLSDATKTSERARVEHSVMVMLRSTPLVLGNPSWTRVFTINRTPSKKPFAERRIDIFQTRAPISLGRPLQDRNDLKARIHCNSTVL